MDHPAIAKVLDAGSTPQGAPYFVMEYVAGVPITTYCDNHKLTTRDRLELFMHVCEGVQHAHQKAIIHRDLKPSNILVTEVDGHPAPKIIDFGVAKALTQKLTADTMFTRVGAMIGTPEYMSPEQALSSGEDIDTRTDVYSLGIIFYELLAGAPPIELRKVAFEEFLRRLREDDPQKPSTKIRTQDPATSTDIAQKRQTEPPALARQMRGDLDSIALKALEKDRARRYGSPSDFAADIHRYLRNEAVSAVPPSLGYRARKFARRYRVALVTACAFGLVLIAAAAISIRQSIRANQEAAVAEAVNNFLQNDMLAQASSFNQSKPDPDLRVRTALDRAAQRITGKFEKQPEVEAAIRETIGQTYVDLGLYPDARRQLERAVDLYRRALGAKNPRTLKAMSRLGRLTSLEGKAPEAEKIISQTLEIQRRVLGPEHPDTLWSMNNLVTAYLDGRDDQHAEAIGRQALEIERRVLGQEHPDTLASMNNLAVAVSEQGKYKQAEALASQCLEIRRRVFGPEHPATVATMNNLAFDYFHQGKNAQAETIYTQVLEMRRRALGPDHPDTLASMTNLALAYEADEKYEQAQALISQALESQRRVLGPEHHQTLQSENELAVVYFFEGKFAQAETLARQILDTQRRVLGPEHHDTVWSMNNVALYCYVQGKYAQAAPLYREVVEIVRRQWGPESTGTLGFTTNLADVYRAEGKYAQSEALYAQTLAIYRRTIGSEKQATLDTMVELALTYYLQKKFAPSEALAREALETDRQKRPDDWQRFFAASMLGASLAGQQKYAEAEPLLLEGYGGIDARKGQMGIQDHAYLDRARDWTVQLYQAWGKPQKAAEWKKK
jgi:tetratricopeptide (TPR) repeat protein